jgi:hypothetical protein
MSPVYDIFWVQETGEGHLHIYRRVGGCDRPH